MGVVSAAYVPDPHRQGESRGAEGTVRRYMQVIVDDPQDNESTIYASGQVPAYFSALPSNFSHKLRNIGIEHSNPWRQWMVTLEYSNEPITDKEKDKAQPNPLLRKAIYHWQTREVQEPIAMDGQGANIVNSAGDLHDPPPERESAEWVVTIEKNLANVPTWFLNMQNTVNSSEFTMDGVTIIKGAARLAGLDISENLEENGFTYRKVVITIALRRPKTELLSKTFNGSLWLTIGDPQQATEIEGWDLILLDHGFREIPQKDSQGNPIATADRKKRQILDDEGEPISSPALLNGKGELIKRPTAGDGKYLKWKVYPEADFSVLPLT